MNIVFEGIDGVGKTTVIDSLKKDLEETARLKNPNAVQPTLEKQMSCILTNSAYTYETLRQIPIRNMVMLF